MHGRLFFVKINDSYIAMLPTRSKNSSGFSLIEILISVAILVLVSFLALAALSVLPKQVTLDSTSQGILSVLRLARSQTLGSKGADTYGVYFETGKYVLFKGDTYVSGASENKEYTLSDVEINSISLTGGGSSVVFDRIRGTTASDGTIQIRLTRDTARTATIQINPSGQVSASATLSQNSTRLVDSRHLHFDLGWSIQNSNTLTLSFTDTPNVTQNIAMAGFFDGGKTVFDWSGTITVNGSDQILRVHTHSLDNTTTLLSVTRDKRYNNKALTISIDGKAIVSYTAAGVATIGAYGGAMTVQ